jgi:hypothetical protein
MVAYSRVSKIIKQHYKQGAVSRKFRLTEDYTISANKVVQNATIKKFLIVACDVNDTQHIEQNLVIRNFLIVTRSC